MRTFTDRLRTMIRRQEAYAASRGLDLKALSPFLAERPQPTRALVLHLSADRGMCGSYNISINRVGLELVESLGARGLEVEVFAKGAKGERHLTKKGNVTFAETEGWLRAGVTEDEVDRIFDRICGGYLDGTYDEVWCAYTQFFTPLKRLPTAVRLLPLASERAEDARSEAEAARWFYEPAFDQILSELLQMFLRLQIEDVLLESYASEQGARMITMEEATERAGKMLQLLRVQHNRLRRESITTDLLGVLFASRLREKTGS